jgi:hypothetical protein
MFVPHAEDSPDDLTVIVSGNLGFECGREGVGGTSVLSVVDFLALNFMRTFEMYWAWTF